jgi:hypothetical protein
MRSKLTATRVVAAPVGRHHLRVTGLYLDVTANGTRRFVYRYSRPNGAGVTEMTLGTFPQVEAKQAVAKLHEAGKLLAAGTDPVAAARATKRQADADAVTLAIALNRYTVAFARGAAAT